MNVAQCTIVQNLIVELDDTHPLYAKLEPLLIRPHLKFLIGRIDASHAAIADDLAWHMDSLGGLTARRGGGALATLRANAERWVAVTNVDIDLGCLKRVARHEVRVIQRFRATLDDVKELHQNLHRELRELVRAVGHVAALMHEIEAPPLAVAPRTATVTSLSTHRSYRS